MWMLTHDHLQETERVWTDKMNLTDLAVKHNTDKAWHGYTGYYERHFADLQPIRTYLLEIGVASGASMRMWNDWFTNKSSSFVGIDIEEKTPKNFDDRTSVIIADGTDYNWTGQRFDIIIDDGSHVSDDIVRAIHHWWPKLNHGGWYVVEDLAVQVRNDYGGSAMGSEATSLLLSIIKHEVMLGHAGDKEWGVSEVHIYDEIVFLRKA